MLECGNTYSISHMDRGIMFKKNNVLNAYILSNGTIHTGSGSITTNGISASSITVDSMMISSNRIKIGGNAGTTGQVLASGGTTGNVYWTSAGSQTLSAVLSNNSVANHGQSITLSTVNQQLVLNDDGAIRMYSGTSQSTLNSNYLLMENTGISTSVSSNQIQLHGLTTDLVLTSESISINGNIGSTGQVLGKQGSSLSWMTVVSGATSLASVLSSGSTANVNQSIQLSSSDSTYPGGVLLNLNDNGAIGIVGLGTTFTNYDSVILNGKGLSINQSGTSTKNLKLTSEGISSIHSLYLVGSSIHMGTTFTTNINVGWTSSSSYSQTTLNGKVEFSVPPQSVDPLLGNELATKGYVDTLIGNYSGNGMSLYFNLSSAPTYPATGVLGQTLISANQSPSYTVTNPSLGTNLIATFTTDVGFPNTTTVPVGLWSMLIYGYTTSAVGQLFYHFKVIEVTSLGTTEIASSGYSSDVNTVTSATPNAFTVAVPILTPYTLQSTASRLRIEIYSTGTGTGDNTLTTLFGGLYYSFMTTTLSGTSLLLTSNNTWTGTNAFSITPTAPTATVGTANTSVATTSFVDTSFLKISSAASTYATTASLSEYVTSSGLTTTLSSYATTASLSNYATTSSLSDYATSSGLTTTLSSYATTASLSNYATTASLSDYVTSGNLTTTLSSYATTSSLSSYATTSSLSSYATTASLSDYVTSGSLTTTLSPYAKTNSGNTWSSLQTFNGGFLASGITSTGTITTVGITSTGTLQLGAGGLINTNNSSINTGTGGITVGGILTASSFGITSTGTLQLGSGSGINTGTSRITVGGTITASSFGITSTGTLQLGSGGLINTNNSSINTGSGNITSSNYLLVGIGTTLGVSISTSLTLNQIKINTDPGLSGQVLTSGGPSGGVSWSTVSGSGGAAFPDIETVFTTSGNVTSSLDVTIPNGYVWLTPTAGTATGRSYNLPTSATPGYTVVIRNNSGASWLAVNNMTNGSIFGAGTGNNLTIGNNTTAVIKYLGVVLVGGVLRNIWVS